jgi:hypothetical protein
MDFSDSSTPRTISTPVTVSLLAADRGDNVSDERRTYYQRKVGELNWISGTRPDLRFALSFLAGFLQEPRTRELAILDRVGTYLKQHPGSDYPLVYHRSDGPTQLVVITDAAYAPLYDRSSSRGRSRAGVIIMIRDVGCVLFESHLQSYVTTSTTEAEMLSMYIGVQRAFPLQHMLREFGEDLYEILLIQDNTSTIQRVIPEVFRYAASQTKSKYQGVAGFWLADHVERGDLGVVWCPTTEMLADMLTKQGEPNLFGKFVCGIRDVTSLSNEFIKVIGSAKLRGCVDGSLLDLPIAMPHDSGDLNDYEWNE